MTAGALAESGYFMGDQLWPAYPGNPKGIFEDREVNGVNEEVLAPLVPGRWPLVGRWVGRSRPGAGQRWLARVPLDARVAAGPDLAARMQALVARAPFCFKDPRFCYTLPAWRPVLDDAVYICVFRDPANSARSMMKEVATARYLRDLTLTYDQAVEVWRLMYAHVLTWHRHHGAWLFLHYDQIVSGPGLDALAAFTGATVDRTFPTPSLRHEHAADAVSAPVQDVYRALCEQAGYEPRGSAGA